MKKLITVAGLLAVCLVIAAKSHAYTPTSGTKIAGSKHDFSVSYAGNGGVTTPAINQCSTCHEMHRPAKMNPLWAREDPTATGWSIQSHDVKYDLTDGTNGFIAAADFVKARSGMCLSCHDGVTTISNGVTMAAGVRANFGRDLSENHNIGRNRGTTSGGVAVDQAILDTHDQVPQLDGTVKYYIGCGSCHAMHNSKTNLKLVRDASAAGVTGPVCLNCHTTK